MIQSKINSNNLTWETKFDSIFVSNFLVCNVVKKQSTTNMTTLGYHNSFGPTAKTNIIGKGSNKKHFCILAKIYLPYNTTCIVE